MSLHNLATQMAAQGRGPDRTLVHMSPKEVQGLQALAMAHGGSLTINPETGLPEAGFLDNLLPAIAGFALDAFVPGAGEAVGGMFGLEGAAASQLGSALTVGGISGLASGSLEKGIMAGMGAYGGAGLAQSMIGSGTNSLASAAESASGPVNATKLDAAMNTSPSATVDRLSALKAGAGSAFDSPKDFLKDNKMNLALLAAPVLMDSFGNKDTSPAANASPGYIRTMKRDPVTGQIYQESATPTGEWGGRSVGTYGGVPARGMAAGGEVLSPMTEEQRLKSIVEETNGPNSQVAYDTRTDSQKALAYLMGEPGSTNPMLFTRTAPTGPIQPADFATRTGGHYVLDAATNTYTWVPDAAAPATAGLDAINNQNRGGRDKVESSNPTWDAMSDLEKSNWFQQPENAGMKKFQELLEKGWGYTLPGAAQNFFDPSIMTRQQAITSGDLVRKAQAPVYDGGVGGAYGSGSVQGGITPGELRDAVSAAGEVTGGTSGYEGSTVTPSSMISGGLNQGPGYASYDTGSRGDNTGRSDTEGRGEPGDRGDWGRGGGYANGGIAALAGGGLGSLGGYSDGGQLLRGPGDGVSDSIPAKIGRNQPARLADGEFVVPARIVSELGNGSTEAGAKQLYKMLDRIQAGRKKTVGKNKVAVNSKSVRHLPA